MGAVPGESLRGEGYKSKAHPAGLEKSRSSGLFQVPPGPGMEDPPGINQSDRIKQGLRAVIHGMVVRQAHHLEAPVDEALDHLRGGMERLELPVLRHPVIGQGRLEVAAGEGACLQFAQDPGKGFPGRLCGR